MKIVLWHPLRRGSVLECVRLDAAFAGYVAIRHPDHSPADKTTISNSGAHRRPPKKLSNPLHWKTLESPRPTQRLTQRLFPLVRTALSSSQPEISLSLRHFIVNWKRPITLVQHQASFAA